MACDCKICTSINFILDKQLNEDEFLQITAQIIYQMIAAEGLRPFMEEVQTVLTFLLIKEFGSIEAAELACAPLLKSQGH